jgi:hypothetical protein
MSDTSPLVSPAGSTTSFSTACTSLPPTDISQPQKHPQTDEKSHYPPEKPLRNDTRPHYRREVTNQTLLLSSPLATLIYTASSTAAALSLNSATSDYIIPRSPVISGKGNMLRKKRATGRRPERLVRMAGRDAKVVMRNAAGHSQESL